MAWDEKESQGVQLARVESLLHSLLFFFEMLECAVLDVLVRSRSVQFTLLSHSLLLVSLDIGDVPALNANSVPSNTNSLGFLNLADSVTRQCLNKSRERGPASSVHVNVIFVRNIFVVSLFKFCEQPIHCISENTLVRISSSQNTNEASFELYSKTNK